MKFIITAFIFLVSSATCFSQAVIGGAGTYHESSNGYSLAWTLGEPVTETGENQDQYLTQGFHQSSFTLVYTGDKEKPELNVSVYPNPVADQVTVEFGKQPDEDMRYNLFDLSGRSVFSGRISSSSNRINMSGLANAQYLLIIHSNSSEFRETYKLQKIK